MVGIMDTQYQDTDIPVKSRIQVCPTCGQVSQFSFLGEQRWPPHVVEATGLGPVVHLWVCGHCQTTLTETYVDSSG